MNTLDTSALKYFSPGSYFKRTINKTGSFLLIENSQTSAIQVLLLQAFSVDQNPLYYAVIFIFR